MSIGGGRGGEAGRAQGEAAPLAALGPVLCGLVLASLPAHYMFYMLGAFIVFLAKLLLALIILVVGTAVFWVSHQ